VRDNRAAVKPSIAKVNPQFNVDYHRIDLTDEFRPPVQIASGITPAVETPHGLRVDLKRG